MRRRSTVLVGVLIAGVALSLAPAGASHSNYTVVVTNPAPQVANGVWVLSLVRAAGCFPGPVSDVVSDPQVPGIDSKAIPTSHLGLGSTPATRKIKVELASAASADGVSFYVQYIRGSTCSTFAQTNSGSSVTATVPDGATWVIVTASSGPGALVEFKVRKV